MSTRTDELETKQAKRRAGRAARGKGLGPMDFKEMSPAAFKRLVTREGASPAAIGLYITYGVLEKYHGGGPLFTNELIRWLDSRWEDTGRESDLDYWIALGDYLAWLEGHLSRAALLVWNSIEYTEIAALFVERGLYAATLSACQAAAPGDVEVAGLTAAEVAGIVRRAKRLEPLGAGESPEESYENLIAGRRLLREHIATLVAAQRVVADAAALLEIPRLVSMAADSMSDVEDRLAGPWDDLDGLPDKWAAIFTRREDIAPGGWDTNTERVLEDGLALYLSAGWRKMARAGMSLREIAGRSTGVADMLRRAGREYAALGVSEDE